LQKRTRSDEELVRLAQQGELDAFTQLYDRHLSSVYNHVRYRVPEQDVDDVTQEVFIAALKSLKSFRCEAKFSTWLRTITNRNIADYYRCREDLKDQLNFTPTEMRSQIGKNAATSESRVDDRMLLRQGFRTLPEHYREVILLRFAEGLKFAEIAETRGQSLDAAKSLFRRAISKLRQQIDSIYDCQR
jgi:RNA polymerase sigma-70 factor (ECF subfamily)